MNTVSIDSDPLPPPPQVPEVEIDLGRAPTRLRIVARNLSAQNRYVKSVTFNGVPVNGVTIRHEDLVRGGELIFEMCAEPPKPGRDFISLKF